MSILRQYPTLIVLGVIFYLRKRSTLGRDWWEAMLHKQSLGRFEVVKNMHFVVVEDKAGNMHFVVVEGKEVVGTVNLGIIESTSTGLLL